MNEDDFRNSIIEMIVNDDSNNIITDFTLEDYKRVRLAHEMGNIKFIHIGLVASEYVELVIIDSEVSYFYLQKISICYNNIMDIFFQYKDKNLISNLIEYEINGSYLKYIEICDKYISFIDDSNMLLFCGSENKFYNFYLTEYNLKLL